MRVAADPPSPFYDRQMPPVLQLPGGVEAVIRVRGEETGGAFTLLTDTAPPGWLLPPHRHGGAAETICVTGGRLWMTVDGERLELGPGEAVHIPAGVRHEGGTLGAEPIARVVLFSPSGMEEFFEQLAATPEPSAMLALATRHGWSFE
jgi:quercetin dioxygenase-like cupin family protein